jgi:hypothetical protein
MGSQYQPPEGRESRTKTHQSEKGSRPLKPRQEWATTGTLCEGRKTSLPNRLISGSWTKLAFSRNPAAPRPTRSCSQ